MRIRSFIPQIRIIASALTGLTAGVFVATGMAWLAWGYVPPAFLRISGTLVAYVGLIAVACLALIDRRRRDRPQTPV